MFRRSDSQTTFGSLSALLSPKKIARLEKIPPTSLQGSDGAATVTRGDRE